MGIPFCEGLWLISTFELMSEGTLAIAIGNVIHKARSPVLTSCSLQDRSAYLYHWMIFITHRQRHGPACTALGGHGGQSGNSYRDGAAVRNRPLAGRLHHQSGR
jgi:hypothetical protein